MIIKLPKLNLNLSPRVILGIAVLTIFVGGVVAFSMPTTPAVEGWEVQNNIYDIRVNGVTYTMASGTLPEHAYLWTDKGIRFDVDNETYGVADIDVSLGPPREKILDTSTGEWVNARVGEVFFTYGKAINETYFFWDHHIFFFEATTVMTPDFIDYTNIFGVQTTYGEADGMLGSPEEAQILLKLNFKLSPWVNAIMDQFSDNDSVYRLDEERVWTGIMSAQILSVEAMFVGWPEGSDPPNGEIDPYQVGGAQLSIMTDVGTFSDTSDRVGEELEDRPADMAPSEAHVAVGMDMIPAWSREQWGTTDIYPAQLKYRFRFDVLSTAGYDLIDGSMDEKLDNKSHLKGALKPIGDFFTALGAGLEAFNLALQDLLGAAYGPLIMLAVIVVAALIFYLLMKLGILKRGTGGGG